MIDYLSRLDCAVVRVELRIDEGQDPHEAAAEFSRAYTVSSFDILAIVNAHEERSAAQARIVLRKVAA